MFWAQGWELFFIRNAEKTGANMRSSFVFHAEFIEDLPQSYQAQFSIYTINYGLKGEIPPIEKETLEWALWVKIQRRIDSEHAKYEEIRQKRIEAGKKRWAKKESEKQLSLFGEEDRQDDPQLSFSETENSVPAHPIKNGIEKETPQIAKEEGKKAEPQKSARFQKPTIDSIRNYCKEKNYTNVDPERFVNYYESNGWMVGRNKMKNWKFAVANWDKNAYFTKGQKGAVWDKERTVSAELYEKF